METLAKSGLEVKDKWPHKAPFISSSANRTMTISGARIFVNDPYLSRATHVTLHVEGYPRYLVPSTLAINSLTGKVAAKH